MGNSNNIEDYMDKTEFLVLDNGSHPFLIKHDNDNKLISIYKRNNSYNVLIKQYNYEQLYIRGGWDSVMSNFVYPGHDDYHNADHNSVLAKIGDKKYVHIGCEIYEFETLDDIIEYYSPCGNNLVPYPIALGNKYVYMMSDNVYVNRNKFSFEVKWDDAYSEYYGHSGLKIPLNKFAQKMKNLKIIHKRLW